MNLGSGAIVEINGIWIGEISSTCLQKSMVGTGLATLKTLSAEREEQGGMFNLRTIRLMLMKQGSASVTIEDSTGVVLPFQKEQVHHYRPLNNVTYFKY